MGQECYLDAQRLMITVDRTAQACVFGKSKFQKFVDEIVSVVSAAGP
jgi:hypothetical protein